MTIYDRIKDLARARKMSISLLNDTLTGVTVPSVNGKIVRQPTNSKKLQPCLILRLSIWWRARLVKHRSQKRYPKIKNWLPTRLTRILVMRNVSRLLNWCGKPWNSASVCEVSTIAGFGENRGYVSRTKIIRYWGQKSPLSRITATSKAITYISTLYKTLGLAYNRLAWSGTLWERRLRPI